MTARIERAALQFGSEIARGGQGRVLRVLNRTDDRNRPMVYKEYLQAVAGAVDEEALDRLGELPRTHAEAEEWLLECTAWPQVLVEHQGRVTGFLMQVIPDRFRFELTTMPGETTAKPAEYAFLLNSDAYVQASGLVVTDQHRLLLLADVAAALGRFHGMGVTVGDLSPKNLLFASDRSHRTFFIDCDAMTVGGATVLKQAHTPDWGLPADDEERGTAAADNYKFGLLAIRLFARSQESRDASAIGAVSPRLGLLARMSQEPDPAARPQAVDWVESLQEGARQAAARPTPATPGTADTSPPYPAPVFTAGQPRIPAQMPTQPAAYAAASAHTSTRQPRKHTSLTAAIVTAVVAVFIAIAVGVHSSQSSASGSGTTASGDTGGFQQSAPVSPSPSPQPSNVGIVALDSSITGDPRAQQVAAMFDTFFSAISRKDYATALAEYDPNGRVDPNDPAQATSFEQAVSTSNDSDVVLQSLSPSGPGPASSAQITFQSTQDAGYGPPGDENQTCTDWTLTYTLTYTDAGGYLIYSSNGSSAGC
jgi:eukaryotic-like serine/threonine-protein kinase